MKVPWGSFDSLLRVQEKDKNKGYQVGKRKSINEEELRAILARAKAAADEPVAELDFDPTDLTTDWSSFPAVSPAASTVPAGCKPLPASGTQPISIRVPVWVLRSFREQAAKTGISYQTLMNQWLKTGVASFV